MVYDVIGCVAHSVERASRVQVAGHSRPHVNVLSYSLDASCLVEVSSTDTLAHDVPFEAAAGERKLLLQEDVFKLGPDLSHLEVIIRVNYNAVRANSIIINSQFHNSKGLVFFHNRLLIMNISYPILGSSQMGWKYNFHWCLSQAD